MKRAIKTHLPNHGRPYEWAIMGGETLYTVASALREDGSRENGNATKQATVALENLARILAAAGGTMADVTQTMLYVTDRRYLPPIAKVWEKAFPKPQPNRASVVVKETGVPGAKLVVMVTAYIPKARQKAAKRPSPGKRAA